MTAKSRRSKQQVYSRGPDNMTQGKDIEEDDDEELTPESIIPNDPLFKSFCAEGIGNMPELTVLLQDEEILHKFQEDSTKDLLIQIAKDPSKIESLLDRPEIHFLRGKITVQFAKSRAERRAPDTASTSGAAGTPSAAGASGAASTSDTASTSSTADVSGTASTSDTASTSSTAGVSGTASTSDTASTSGTAGTKGTDETVDISGARSATGTSDGTAAKAAGGSESTK